MSANGPQDKLAVVAERLDRLADLMERVLDSAKSSPGTVQQVNIPQAQQAATRGERIVWVMGVLVLLMAFVATVSMITALFQGQRVTDLRVDMQAERARNDAHAAWARDEAQIIRSYIWQGKVPSLNPYPNLNPEPRK